MNEIITELNKLKSGIDEAKKQVSNLEGRKEEALKRLKDEFHLNTVELAEKWLAKTGESLQKQEKEIKVRFERLKEQYEW